jgi:hypothetical protein
LAVKFLHQPGQAAGLDRLQPARHFLGGYRILLERDGRITHVMVVDGGENCPIVGFRTAYQVGLQLIIRKLLSHEIFLGFVRYFHYNRMNDISGIIE